MRVVRSSYAHGRIVSVDVSQALTAPGVIAAWTAADVADLQRIALREGPDPQVGAQVLTAHACIGQFSRR